MIAVFIAVYAKLDFDQSRWGHRSILRWHKYVATVPICGSADVKCGCYCGWKSAFYHHTQS